MLMSLFFFNEFVVKNGRANDILKFNSKRRKRKIELVEERQKREVEKRHIEELKETESVLKAKRYKMDDIPNVVRQNEEMVKFLQTRGMMNELGEIKQ